MKNFKNIVMFILGICFCGFGLVFMAVCIDVDSAGELFISIILSVTCIAIGVFLLYLSKSIFSDFKVSDIENQKNDVLNEKNMLQEDILKLKNEKEKLLNNIDELSFKNQSLLDDEERLLKKVNSFREKIGKDNIEYVDEINGLEFEEYIKDLLERLGYKNVIKTPASGDFGVDVIAEKDNIKYAIQCKNYQEQLSNKCVQEAFSGKQHYNCHVGVVVTNSYFSPHAIEQAKSTGVLLWDRDKLISMINELKK